MMDKTIIIKVRPDGNVEMKGPLHDKKLCYKLLEIAKKLVEDYRPSAIIKPSHDLKKLEV